MKDPWKEAYFEIWGRYPEVAEKTALIGECWLCHQIRQLRWGTCADCRAPVPDVVLEGMMKAPARLSPSLARQIELNGKH